MTESGDGTPGHRGGHTYKNIAVRYPDPPAGGLTPLLSSSADGFRSMTIPWGPTITDSYFEGMNDDGEHLE
jgi:hypothetical protein